MSSKSFRRRFVARVFRSRIARAKATYVMDGTLPLTGIHRILICRPNHRLGNTLFLTPLVVALEGVYPGAEVDLLIGCEAGPEIFSGFRRVRHIAPMPARMARHPLLLWRTIKQLRKTRYDLVIDAGRGSQSGHIFAGMIKGRYLLAAQDTVDDDRAAQREHFAHRPVDALARALVYNPRLKRPFPQLTLRLSETERSRGLHVLNTLVQHQPSSADGVVGVFADATGTKRHSPEWWWRFLDHLQQQRPGVRIIEFVPAYGQSPLDCRLPTFSSASIRALAALASQCACFVSADCGVMHLASAGGATTFGLFSCTHPDLYGPFGNHSRALLTSQLTPEDVANVVVDHLKEKTNQINNQHGCDANRQREMIDLPMRADTGLERG